MSNDVMEKPALDALLDTDLHELVECTASRYYRVYGKNATHSSMITQEDLALEGFAAIVAAYASFDPVRASNEDLNKAFRTFVFPYMNNAMKTYCRKFGHALSISEKAARFGFNDMIGINVIHMDQLHEESEFDIPVGSGIESSCDVDDFFFAGFSEFERKISKERFLEGCTLQEIADRNGMSKSRTGEVLRGLTERLRIKAEDYVQNH